jgi:hypothetical protein
MMFATGWLESGPHLKSGAGLVLIASVRCSGVHAAGRGTAGKSFQLQEGFTGRWP